jgi:hypothetical protein
MINKPEDLQALVEACAEQGSTWTGTVKEIRVAEDGCGLAEAMRHASTAVLASQNPACKRFLDEAERAKQFCDAQDKNRARSPLSYF